MTTTQIVVLIVVVLLLAALAAVLVARAKRAKERERLRSTFGPEYDRTVEGNDGHRRQAERELAERAARRSSLDIRPLPEADRTAFVGRWQSTQAEFVDQPGVAVKKADRLVAEVMERRGYPVGDFDQQARDVSVDHAEVVQEYRAAHDISLLNDRDQASTEQLRQAMVHYRALFNELLHDGQDDGRRDDARPAVVVDERPHADVGERVDDRALRDTGTLGTGTRDTGTTDAERVDVVRVRRERLDDGADPVRVDRLRDDRGDDDDRRAGCLGGGRTLGNDEVSRSGDDRRLVRDDADGRTSVRDDVAYPGDDRSSSGRTRVEPGGLRRDDGVDPRGPRTEPGGLTPGR